MSTPNRTPAESANAAHVRAESGAMAADSAECAMRHPSGDACASLAPGHGLHPMRRRVAAATPSRWIDALVASADDSGRLRLVGFAGEAISTVWHHRALGAGDGIVPGAPVALHPVYGVLAVGRTWLSVQLGPAPAAR